MDSGLAEIFISRASTLLVIICAIFLITATLYYASRFEYLQKCLSLLVKRLILATFLPGTEALTNAHQRPATGNPMIQLALTALALIG